MSADHLPPAGSLLAEGRQMLHAISQELARMENVEIVIPIDRRIRSLVVPALPDSVRIMDIDSRAPLEQLLDSPADTYDHALIIAPEIDNALHAIVNRVQSHANLLSPNSMVIEIASDKWRTYQFLKRSGIKTPETFAGQQTDETASGNRWIIKPRFGAGSMDVHETSSIAEVHRLTRKAPGAFLIQEPVRGLFSSIAAWKFRDGTLIFPAMEQRFGAGFEVTGFRGPLPDELQQRARRLLGRLLECLPDFSGYAGVDLVLGEESDQDDLVLEINPRLTTSFCQTRKLIQPGSLQERLQQDLLHTSIF